MAFSYYKAKRTRFIFILYWVLLFYIIAALVFWFIELNRQNQQMIQYEMNQLKKDDPQFVSKLEKVNVAAKRKTAQYLGEGSVFFLLILAGAFFIYRAVRSQFKAAKQQQDFMMAITHELKTPIAITKLNLETLQKRKLDDAQQQRLIQNTLQEANRLNALCNNMLLASQIEAGAYSITKDETNLSELVNGCIHDFVLRFPQRNIVAEVNDDIFMDCDPLLMQMAINNLIDNAIKYSPKESPVIVSLNNSANKTVISVRDEGKGIEQAEKMKVFDKFYRVGNAATKGAKGTGLGLYLTKKIVLQHNANIFVTDNKPSGANFTIEI